ncbi:hypothetical protein IVA80_26910 [Bradyrhizobium sp. 139]|nr:hypothetical protein [Bradyrhizobium sp. 139]
MEDKVLSVFEPSTEIIRKDKTGKPNEFGKMICRLSLCPAPQWRSVDPGHRNPPGGVPGLLAADAGFYSARNEAAARALGVTCVCIPNRPSKSPERKREQKKRWFRDGQKWRTGCEERISVVKRRKRSQSMLIEG